MKIEVCKEDYEYLWGVGIPYIFTSAFAESRYGESGMIICQNNGIYQQFISKNERKKLSAEGIELYSDGFDEYERKAKMQADKNKVRLEELYGEELSKLPNEELAGYFNEHMMFLAEALKDYFYTEYFMTELVEEVVDKEIKEHNLKKIKENVDRMSKLKFYQRENLNKYFGKPSVFDLFIKEINKRSKLKQNGHNYKYQELTALLLGENVEIPNRTYVVWVGRTEIAGDEAKRAMDNLLHIVDENMVEFKGRIGNKGHYIGKVKKIDFHVDTDYAKEISQMQKGEILVSDSTGPEMILACKKAGAIITDEGGITSHAALVSRELGIPSVIGTKIATRVLKDGDLVEVDADKGIVKIIERAI